MQYYPKKTAFLQNKIRQHETHRKYLAKQKNIVEEQLEIVKEQYKRDSSLYKKDIIAYEELESAKNQYLQALLSFENMNFTLENMEMELIQMQEGILDVENQYVEKKNSLEAQIKTYINQLSAEIQNWELTYAFIAPIDGKITFTDVWAQNQNITTGQNVFNIVPDIPVTLMGKALLPMLRSGKVKSGQQVNIRFNSFPNNEYGIVRGKVKNISLVPIQNENGANYVLNIDLPQGLTTTYGKELPYLPEMKAQADIITENISLLERLIMPVRKILTENSHP
jgi:HlyD family secretion protein